MNVEVVVVKPFLGFARGDLISDPLQIDRIMDSEHRGCVVRVMASSPAGS
jgi:hypothetical protein